ncbi:hypothetical protein [Actinomyces succiniciruminis]|uniref:Uncharacterized protein n=1 Tax=Actinomyces succiniciruminis TaxID=1522002 RepID=A0A1L7RM58_9ACTO|nr:hypothetical protein [Actinomyces succiniciruminis]CED91270.1 Hypothetical protein AAM4_1438 [Actinomyces succiniciruminis]
MALIIVPAYCAIIVFGFIGSATFSDRVRRVCEALFVVALIVILTATLWQFWQVCKTAITTVDSITPTATTTQEIG